MRRECRWSGGRPARRPLRMPHAAAPCSGAAALSVCWDMGRGLPARGGASAARQRSGKSRRTTVPPIGFHGSGCRPAVRRRPPSASGQGRGRRGLPRPRRRRPCRCPRSPAASPSPMGPHHDGDASRLIVGKAVLDRVGDCLVDQQGDRHGAVLGIGRSGTSTEIDSRSAGTPTLSADLLGEVRQEVTTARRCRPPLSR